ncbi:glycogen synthase GlgA [Roseivivax sp. GX 12232]|uniref:glycogen synthase GlgA n=1 Tax=Roseivivax sp. GX 12232 TaxID=2900547 RepID=UPI001E4FF3B5|nr:glycogen synthase GlgA [Roseivivax sp. GX 12232]MCE0504660.1 glycogen synthase GlgA [Roseivivax sp. GX 12232]
MTRVLSVASECVPLIKTGGLADVAGALPGALAPLGVEMRTLLPAYPKVRAALGEGPRHELGEVFGGPAALIEGQLGEAVLYALDAPHLFDRPGGPYLDEGGHDFPDNPRRFAALSQVAARLAAEGIGDWHPEVLHVHDWQAGLAPLYLSQMAPKRRVGTLLTIHNIAFQGMAPPSEIGPLGLPEADFGPEGYEFWGQVSALKAGLVWSDRITTVSPTYAEELLTPEFGMGLDGLLTARRDALSGILNGIDTAAWAPPYRTPRGKPRHRARLRHEMGLPEAEGPLCVVISRLSHQKGLDVLLDALPALIDHGGQLALLGSGDPALESAFRQAAEHPNVATRIGYDEALSKRMVAGGDAILVPSRFEPCGLTQLYGLSHGTLPLVARTGGLNDTVIDANPMALQAGAATGLQFHPVTASGLAGAFARLHALWRAPGHWQRMMKNAMALDVGWDVSAQAYATLYRDLISAP